MKPRLVILSDLWGVERAEWLDDYIKLLEVKFDLKYYDCCDLGQVDKSDYEESSLHHQFVNGGIEMAARRLLKQECDELDILAFSVGGVIAWKAQLLGLKVRCFYAVSSTRLRKELDKPRFQSHLYFGADDTYRPDSEWYDRMGVHPYVFKDKGHGLYTDVKCINEICHDILRTSN